MQIYDKQELALKSKELHVVRDTLEKVCDFIKNEIYYEDDDIKFLKEFGNGKYIPNLLFDDRILNRILNHPIALWKVEHNLARN